eukprot:gnl/TRDRNA2_/TRDRNA2_126236_c0_seq1.p1 gnl/TRDRNA2_/TRDRNA2_126236_c0~~gnl/TRDRNA2_/TRDRNA2_126236_c0_seq1.p1  ORF type:complete len:185 (-),score=62.04 gnl/TRDRNA2_/TRDRNA2_126236_c0_seq1:108-662(-)
MGEISKLVMENELLLWKTPIKSGAVLAVVDLIFCIYFFFEINIIVLLRNICLLAFGVGAVLKMAGSQQAESIVLISDSSISQVSEAIASSINGAVSSAQEVVAWKNQKSSLMAMGAIFVVSRVSLFLSVSLAAVVVFNLLFVVPVQLNAQEKLIKEKIEPQLAKVLEQKDKLLNMIPKYDGKDD